MGELKILDDMINLSSNDIEQNLCFDHGIIRIHCKDLFFNANFAMDCKTTSSKSRYHHISSRDQVSTHHGPESHLLNVQLDL